jgi:hypothetical protein
METALQPSSQNIRSKIATIEAIELASLGFLLWFFGAILTLSDPNTSFFDQIMFFAITEAILLGSWALYNAYIRIARAGGRLVDLGLWIVASLLTGSYTFWAWTILDLNRWLMSKLFYRGEAPIEYAWSIRSKRIRKAWEQMQKADTVL